MLHKVIGNDVITTPFFRFETDSGANLRPVFTIGGIATFEWISPNGLISTGVAPNPILNQTGVYTVKCSDWSDISEILFQDDNIIRLDNLHLLTALTLLYCYENKILELDVSVLPALTTLWCYNNGMDEANVDKILAGLVTIGTINGVVWIWGSNAAPSAAGNASVLILEGRGWGVTTS